MIVRWRSVLLLSGVVRNDWPHRLADEAQHNFYYFGRAVNHMERHWKRPAGHKTHWKSSQRLFYGSDHSSPLARELKMIESITYQRKRRVACATFSRGRSRRIESIFIEKHVVDQCPSLCYYRTFLCALRLERFISSGHGVSTATWGRCRLRVC